MIGLAGWLRRLPPLVWVTAVAVVAIGLTAALGGFAPAPDHGRPVEAGERVLTQRWQIRVDRAALIDDSYPGQDPDPRIRVWLRTRYTGDESLCCLTERMIEVRYAGQSLTRIWASPLDPRSTLGYDPDVEVARVLEFPLEHDVLPTTLPDRVEVVIRDERPSRSLILTDWVVAPALAEVDLACPDERSQR